MAGKIISAIVLSILGLAALADFITVQHGHLGQFGFLSLSFGIFSLCAAVLCWRHWDGIHEAYTYDQTAERDGIELPRFAWSERLGMGALFKLGNRPERQDSKNA
jgi:hypothetical protein